MSRRCTVVLVAGVVALWSTGVGAASAPAYIVPRDTEVSLMAKNKKVEMCAIAKNSEVDRELGRREIANAVGGNNIVLAALEKALNQSQVQVLIMEDVKNPGFIFKAAYPIIFAVITVIIYGICCWTGCPCCRCCRACKNKEPAARGMICKLTLLGMVIVALAGILAGGITTISAVGRSVDGFDNVGCATATVLDTTLSGSINPAFIGLLPILKTIDTMDQNFNDGSAMLDDFAKIIDSTKPIEDAVKLASDVLAVLSEALLKADNLAPKGSLKEDLLHECVLCKNLAGPIITANKALSEGAGAALVEARSAVADALGPAERTQLQDSLRAATSTLVEFKVSMRDTFSGFVEEQSSVDKVQKIIKEQGVLIGLVFCIWALILVLFSCCGTCCCFAREKKSDGQYSATPHRIACCVWGCAFIPIFLCFLIGGVLMVVSTPLSAVCDIMDRMDSTLLIDIGPGIGLKLEGDQGEMLQDIMDKCLVTQDRKSNANIMDLVFSRKPDGANETTRDTMVMTLTGPINMAFDGLSKAIGNGTMPSMGNNTGILALRKLLGKNPASAFVLPVRDKINGDSRFTAMMSDTDLRAGVAVSMACADTTPDGIESPGGGSAAIPGINGFVAKLGSRGLQSGPISTGRPCLKQVTCTNPADLACQSGNNFIGLKAQVADSNKYVCRRFLNADKVTTCDLTLMFWNSVTMTWNNDCTIKDISGKKNMYTKDTYCTMQEFEDYLKGFDQVMEKVFARIDTEAGKLGPEINTKLRNLVNTFLITPAMSIIDGVTCGFMPIFYRAVVDGLCFQGVVGLRMVAKSYVVLSFFMVFLAIIMYTFWSFAVSNYNAYVDAEKKSGGSQ